MNYYYILNSIEKIHSLFEEIKNFSGYAGIAGLKLHGDGTLVGSTFDKEFIDCTSLERTKYRILGDKAEVFYTEILKKYPFPVFDNENFLTEEIVWNRIANDGYKIRWFNEGLYFCEYLEGGLSKTSDKGLKNFNGYKLVIKELLRYKEITLKRKIISLMIIGEISLRKKEKISAVARDIDVSPLALFFWAYSGKMIRRMRAFGKRK